MRRWEYSKPVGCTHPAFGAGSKISSASVKSGEIGPESTTDEQMQPLDGRVERAGRDAGGSTVRLLRRQHVDALGAELDGVGDRRVVDHASIDEPLFTDRDRGEYPWDRRRRGDGVDCGACREAHLPPLEQVERDQMERNRRIGEVPKLDVPADQPP